NDESDEAENRLQELKYQKARAKTAFTKARNQLLNLLDEEECPNRKQIREIRRKLNEKQEQAFAAIDALACEYSSRTDRSALRKTTEEIEKLEMEFTDAQNRVQVYFDNTLDDSSSCISQSSTREFVQNQVEFKTESSNARGDQLVDEQQNTMLHQEPVRFVKQFQSTPYHKSTTKVEQNTIGNDLWRQLKRVSIPVFSGDKLFIWGSNEALKTVEKLGHSAIAYEAAKERLDRKYGGTRRQVSLYLEELENFKAIRPGNSKDLEEFVDILDVAVINLQENGRHEELGNGSLYLKLQKKLTEPMICEYHRWIFEKKKAESVLSLRDWVIQESEFQTIAAETVKGLHPGNEKRSKFRDGGRTYFNRDGVSKCNLCNNQHPIWRCNQFKQMTVSERWNFAKQSRLCYRCLSEGHTGRKCTKSRCCGVDGCTKTHNRLLHGYPQTERKEMESNQRENCERLPRNGRSISQATQTFPTTEGEHSTEVNERSLTTRVDSKISQRQEFLAMRTVPVILTNGNRRMTVNALLDDASTKTYINADVAAELGLHGNPQRTNVNVLNGQIETFLTMPVEFKLESLDGKVNTTMEAYTPKK
ncbi:Nucleotide-binding oligomerization domain-containing 2, partial [Paramuricea clavata]